MERPPRAPARLSGPSGTQKIYHTLLWIFTGWRGHYTRYMRTNSPKLLVCAALFAVALTPLIHAAPQRSHTEQSAVVTAYSDPDAPAKGMTETDFLISEDGLNREVIRVG